MKTRSTLSKILLSLVALSVGGYAVAQDCTPTKPLPRLKVDRYKLVFVDHNDEISTLCVTSPGTFQIRIGNPSSAKHQVKLNDVTVTNKSAVGPTIDGQNDTKIKKVDVTVGPGLDPGDELDFLITVKDVGVLDPRVRIVDTEIIERLEWEALNEFLVEETGLTVNDLISLRPPQDD